MGIVKLHEFPTTLPPKELPLLKDLGFINTENETKSINRTPPHQISSEESSEGSFDLYAYTPPSDSDEAEKPIEHVDPRDTSEIDSCNPRDVDQLISFLSRVKYLYKDLESVEAVPITVPEGARIVDQRSIMKLQAEKVRNQMELKFRAIPLAMQADKFIEGYKSTSIKGLYNPLQTIRNRKSREVNGKRFRRLNMWQIPVSELVEDIKWQFQNMKRRTQLNRHRDEPIIKLQQPATPVNPVQKCRNRKSRSHSCSSKRQRRRSLYRQPSNHQISTKNDGTELLDRLKNSHTENEVFIDDNEDVDQAYGQGQSPNQSPSQSQSWSQSQSISANELLPVPMNISHFKTISPFKPNGEDGERKHRPTFCRNRAHIEESWNKIHHHSSSISSQSCISDTGELLPAPSLKKKSVSSSYGSSSDAESLRNINNSTNSSSNTNTSTNNTNNTNNKFPALTVTNDHGHIIQIETEKVQNIAKQSEEYMARQAFDKFVHNANGSVQKPISEEVLTKKEPPIISPTRTSISIFRTPVCEAYMESLEQDLNYLMTLYNRGTTRQGILDLLANKRLEMEVSHSPKLANDFKNLTVPKELEYISKIESQINAINHQVESEVLTTVDGLRIATDVVVSEVNTSLNKELRDLTSRVEKIYTRRNNVFTRVVAYRILEYLVVISLWIVWAVVKVWKFCICLFKFLRGVLNWGN